MRRLALPAVLLVALPSLAADPAAVKIGPAASVPPAGWKSVKPNNLLRSYQFVVPAGIPDLADAEVAVYKEGSPKADQKFGQWKATFTPPEGKTADDISKTSAFDVKGGKVSVLDVAGTWVYNERPFDKTSKAETKPEFRVVWAIVTIGDDTAHVRLSGPEKVVAKHYADFENWLKAFK